MISPTAVPLNEDLAHLVNDLVAATERVARTQLAARKARYAAL